MLYTLYPKKLFQFIKFSQFLQPLFPLPPDTGVPKEHQTLTNMPAPRGATVKVPGSLLLISVLPAQPDNIATRQTPLNPAGNVLQVRFHTTARTDKAGIFLAFDCLKWNIDKRKTQQGAALLC